MNSWILLNKKATHRAHLVHLSTWEPAISEAWVAAASFRRAGVCSPRTTAPGLLRFFTSSLGPVVGPGLESLNFLWPLTPWLRISLYFSLPFIPVSLGHTRSSISPFPKEQIHFSFPTFSPTSFPDISFPFPASFPLSYRISLSELGECFYNAEVWGKDCPRMTGMTFLSQRWHLNRYLKSFHIFTSDLWWCLYHSLILKFRA